MASAAFDAIFLIHSSDVYAVGPSCKTPGSLALELVLLVDRMRRPECGTLRCHRCDPDDFRKCFQRHVKTYRRVDLGYQLNVGDGGLRGQAVICFPKKRLDC